MKLKTTCFAFLLLLALPHSGVQADPAPGAVLELGAEGLVLRLPGREPERFKSLDELRKAHPGFAGSFRMEEAAAPGRIVPDPEKLRRQPVDIVEGRIPALELLHFLADYTGLPVVHDSSNKALAELKVLFSADVKGAGYEVVKAHLEAAGLVLSQRQLPGGKRLIEVTGGTGQARPRALKERPIIIVSKGAPGAAKSTPTRRADDPSRLELEAYMGVVLAKVPDVVRAQLPITSREGVLVLALDRNLTRIRSDLKFLKRYDIITAIDRHSVSTAAGVADELSRFSRGDEFTMRVYRKGSLKIYRIKR